MTEGLLEQILFTEKRIQERVAELGRQIAEDYDGKPLVLVGVLKGAFVFLADLTRAIEIPHGVDFLGAASYRGTESTGQVRITQEVTENLAGKHIVLVEDIYDTGQTMPVLLEMIERENPESVEVCSLLIKDRPREMEIPIKYVGFHIPDVFVIGYGLDFDQRYRNLRCIGIPYLFIQS